MARYNEILTGRFNRLIQKLLSMKGPASLVSVDDSMQAVLPLFHGVENRYLEGWERFAVASVQAAVVGQVSNFDIENPAGSNTIVVIEKLSIAISAADLILGTYLAVGTGFGNLATAIITATMNVDSRTRPNPIAAVKSGSNLPGAVISNFRLQAQANVNLDFIVFEEQELPLLPNQILRFATLGVNEALQFSLVWRERLLEESERT